MLCQLQLYMLEFTAKGIYCRQADVYIDPWKPVKNAIITHGHSDHARSGNESYLCHQLTVNILKLRLGADIKVQGIAYAEPVHINGVTISLHPAGHIIGSAQVRLEFKGETWVVSGDYKIMKDGVSTPFEPVRCHHFITESTFGLPLYSFPPVEKVFEEVNQWWQQNAADNMNTIILGYSLGKAQSILHHLEDGPVYLHGAVANVNDALALSGFRFKGKRIHPEMKKNDFDGAAIVAPVSALGSTWLRRFAPYRIAVCSGWMQLRGARRRYGVDRGFVISDHCDWQQLNTAVRETGAQHVYATHGYQQVFSRWLREEYQLDAREVKTMFEPVDEEE